MSNRKLRIGFLLALAATALYFCYLITAPFLKPILSVAMIAVVCYPLHKWVQRYWSRPNAAALVSLCLITVLVVVPVVLLRHVLMREWKAPYQTLAQQMTEAGGWMLYLSQLLERATGWLQRFVELSPFDLRAADGQQQKQARQSAL